jgi:GTPase
MHNDLISQDTAGPLAGSVLSARNGGTAAPNSRAVLVGVELKGRTSTWTIRDSLAELGRLAATAGLTVADATWQKLERPHPRTWIGSGKVIEVKELCAAHDAACVLFDDELSPGQQKKLEATLGDGIRVIDRTRLILDIFAQHAHTREGKLQVELAQYQYLLPRLAGLRAGLSQQAGTSGTVGLKGPGETQLELDRRQARRRIATLRKGLEEMRSQRMRHRQRRESAGVPVIALVGYTNAGKSSLLNALASADVQVENKLFSTLDPTMRKIKLSSGMIVLATDTVGFIKKLPHNLVAAFRATLEGMSEADLILNVADVSHPMVRAQMATTDSVLAEQGVAEKPRIDVWNKADLLTDAERADINANGSIILTSAKSGEGLDRLRAEIEKAIGSSMAEIEAEIPYAESAILSQIREHGSIQSISHNDTGSVVKALVPDFLMKKIEPYLRKEIHREED